MYQVEVGFCAVCDVESDMNFLRPIGGVGSWSLFSVSDSPVDWANREADNQKAWNQSSSGTEQFQSLNIGV